MSCCFTLQNDDESLSQYVTLYSNKQRIQQIREGTLHVRMEQDFVLHKIVGFQYTNAYTGNQIFPHTEYFFEFPNRIVPDILSRKRSLY